VALICGLVVDETETTAMQQQRAIVCFDGELGSAEAITRTPSAPPRA